jgi:hypothetical protein
LKLPVRLLEGTDKGNKDLGNFLGKSYPPSQSSAWTKQPLRPTVISIKHQRLGKNCPAFFFTFFLNVPRALQLAGGYKKVFANRILFLDR